MRLVDLKTLSEQNSLSVFSFRKYVKLGMPHYRVGRKILVDLKAFEDWFQRFKAGSKQAPDNIGKLVDESIERIR
jgi:hypothetical protein